MPSKVSSKAVKQTATKKTVSPKEPKLNVVKLDVELEDEPLHMNVPEKLNELSALLTQIRGYATSDKSQASTERELDALNKADILVGEIIGGAAL